MNAPASWHETNAAWLSAALAWLRVRLTMLAQAVGETQNVRGGDTQEPGLADGEALREAEARLAACELDATGPLPSLLTLSRHFELSPFEQSVLLLCAGMELDTRIADLCARAQYPARRPYPTFALAMSLFDDAAWDLMSPERPLRYWQLIVAADASEPFITRALGVDERIVSFIKGLNFLDERLARFVVPVTDAGVWTDAQPSQKAALTRVSDALKYAMQGGALPVIQLLGAAGADKLALAHGVAEHLGCRLYRLVAETLPEHAGELEQLARLWYREAMLWPVALYIELPDREGVDEAKLHSTLRRFLSRCDGPCFIDTREPVSSVGRQSVEVDVARPTPAEQRKLWSMALPGRDEHLGNALAAQFDVKAGQIGRIAAQTLARNPQADDEQLGVELWQACSESARPALNRLAARIDARAGWDDLVLPHEQLELLRQISAQVRQRAVVYEDWGFARKMNRGLGISALFSGDSGTGKTMAAEVIANDLRLSLYRIDLSAVVSKYIGETEANLRRLFDAAEDGGAILLFDECDALFGKRSEVKDSHDRYANIEINYLLQRLESYRGLAILATNMRAALDTAFTRRLRFVVHFPFPAMAERKAIWQKVFPRETPCRQLDFERLAWLTLSGGNIHSAALSAAFLAARAGEPVTMERIMAAVRTELTKLGRPVNEGELRIAGSLGARG
ncbi:ATP-binding protein [Paraburkholderia sp. UCT31]|uniref:ATP-binding protein n=1 Tax=Paraburkholderia sp. UCT31 TaxID=2615209 RepID=UPI001655C866|nr:ATP-binding protein [Paraburkholderia sp. UCT31]MBC8737671.1 ATP-binding protein [Paraburkholderia sp. UCT31]